MRAYEIVLIIKPNEEDIIKNEIKGVEELIKKNEGIVEKTDQWGKKRLAYEINEIKEGYYVLITFSAEKPCVKELDRVMRIKENILRHMIISKGE